MSAKALPFQVRVASPCQASWAGMSGDERARFCRLCQKKVYDLSQLTRPEAEALIQQHEGRRLCVRFYQRADGTVLTRDCPVGAARYWRKVRWGLAAATAVLLASVASVFASEQAGAKVGRERFAQRVRRTVDKVEDWFGLRPPAPPVLGKMAAPMMVPTLGVVCPPPNPPVTTTNAPARLLLGEFCPPRTTTAKTNGVSPGAAQ